MLGTKFQHNILTNFVRVFGDLFNNVQIDYYNNSGEIKSTITIPIEYAPRNYSIAKVKDAIRDGAIAHTVPAMSYELGQFSYRNTNKLPSHGRINKIKSDSTTSYDTVYNPVPYDVGVSLYIMTNRMFDMTKIIEQILPFFNPSVNIPIYETDMNIRRDVPVVLNSVSPTDDFEAGEDVSKRVLTYNLDFTAQLQFYGPINVQNIITKTITQFYPNTTNLEADIVTSEISNASSRVTIVPDPLTANIESDYGYTTTINTFED